MKLKNGKCWQRTSLSCEHSSAFTIPPHKLCLWMGILFSHCPSINVCVSVTFCFLNILKSLTEFHQILHTHSYLEDKYV